jgi:hypothetical protein
VNRVATTRVEVVAGGAELRQNSTCPVRLVASVLETSATGLAKAWQKGNLTARLDSLNSGSFCCL